MSDMMAETLVAMSLDDIIKKRKEASKQPGLASNTNQKGRRQARRLAKKQNVIKNPVYMTKVPKKKGSGKNSKNGMANVQHFPWQTPSTQFGPRNVRRQRAWEATLAASAPQQMNIGVQKRLLKKSIRQQPSFINNVFQQQRVPQFFHAAQTRNNLLTSPGMLGYEPHAAQGYINAAAEPPLLPGTRLFVKNLDPRVQEEDLKELFTPAGLIHRVRLFHNQSGQSLGEAEVAFVNKIDARKAYEQFNNIALDGKRVIMELVADISSLHMPQTTMYVPNFAGYS